MGWQGFFLVTLLGLAFGSFAALLLDRLPRRQSVLWPRSRCGHCSHTLSPLELVPVVSYLMLRGRCRACGTQIPPRDLLVELLAGLLPGAAFRLWGWVGALASLCLFFTVIIGVALRRRTPQRSQDGFSLVEAVVAMGLVTLVLVEVIRLFVMAFALHVNVNTRTVVVNLIRAQLDGAQAVVANKQAPASTGWQCLTTLSRDLEWQQTSESWAKEGWEQPDGAVRLYKVTVSVRKNKCGEAPDPDKPPPPAETSWTIVRVPQ